jgi:enoyl-CoA hydratase
LHLQNIVIEKKSDVAWIKINKPESLNALDENLIPELKYAFETMGKDDEVSVIILIGEGKAFVAGADIQQMSSLNPSRAREFANHGMELMTYIENLEKPVIAAVNGFALGGGCELALACDLRIASSKAKFGQPEVGLGITPGFGGTQRLSRLIGSSNAKLLIYTGNIIDANEAYRMGLVNSVVEPDLLISTAEELASNIASKSQVAVKHSKTAINKGIETDIDTGLEIEKNLFALCFASKDQKEGMTAFLEKRKPNFK